MRSVQDEFKPGGVYSDVWGELFRFHHKHAAAKTDDEIMALARELQRFNTVFSGEVAAAIVREIDRILKGGKVGEQRG